MPKKDIKSVASKQSIGSLAQRRRAAMDAAIEGPPKRPPPKKKNTEEMGCGGKVKRMAKGGQCRGMGAATRGGKFSKNG